MNELLSLLLHQDSNITRRNAGAILDTNRISSQYGLSLTQEDAIQLLNTRDQALRENGRLEIGEGILDRIILAFCDSPYLNCENYVDTLCALTELFYYMKTETLEQMSDEELIERMRAYFDGVDQGSLDLLANRELDTMARNIRTYGMPDPPAEPDPVTVDDSGEYPIEEDGKWRTMQL